MEFENIDSLKPTPISGQNERLAELNAVVWFLGCGAGCATGIALSYALLSIWNGAPIWITIVATCIATIHASIIVAFWLCREFVRRRTALMVSMIASAMLMFVLAWIIGANGMQTSPLYGLAFMQLTLAFFHPANFSTKKTL